MTRLSRGKGRRCFELNLRMLLGKAQGFGAHSPCKKTLLLQASSAAHHGALKSKARWEISTAFSSNPNQSEHFSNALIQRGNPALPQLCLIPAHWAEAGGLSPRHPLLAASSRPRIKPCWGEAKSQLVRSQAKLSPDLGCGEGFGKPRASMLCLHGHCGGLSVVIPRISPPLSKQPKPPLFFEQPSS